MINNYEYQVGGSLGIEAPSYVVRKADRALYYGLKKGDFCYVLNSRQMGKSSLLVQAKYCLEQDNFLCMSIDLTNIGTEDITPLQWYKGIATELWFGFNLHHKLSFKTWWKEHEELSLIQRISILFNDLLSHFPERKIVIFIDEVDSILNLNFSVDNFFNLIRCCYNQRSIYPDYYRISFAIFGVATPGDLIQNKKCTPFNIGKAIQIRNFEFDELEPLILGLKSKFENPTQIMKDIFFWTQGQPFLTQKLCQLVLQNDVNCDISVNTLVKESIIKNWETQDEPQHLRNIRDRILYNETNAGRILGLYEQILKQEKITINNSQEQIELLLSGLVFNSHNCLQINNPIYKNIFNLEWVNLQLSNLRPYAVKFDNWLKEDGDNQTNLLQRLELQKALAWAKNKQLSNLDYRFLNESQKLEQSETEANLIIAQTEAEKSLLALQIIQDAHHILVEAKKQAGQQVKQLKLPYFWLSKTAIFSTVLVILLRMTGHLQLMELGMLDFFFRHRNEPPLKPRITIIKIEESDLNKFAQFSLSDELLAKALNTIKNYQPRVIGLDLYRDVPIPSGTIQLETIYQTTPNLIAIENIVTTQIKAPKTLDKLEQVGFADRLLDFDGRVRRALISVRNNNNQTRLSFALRIALEYLKVENITPEFSKKEHFKIQLGQATLVPLKSNDGGYVNVDIGGYQILLNYYGNLKKFDSFSLTDLLSKRIPEEKIKDRVVLIGVTASTIGDLSLTPYTNNQINSLNRFAPVTIQANIINQLLSSALDGRPMLKVWPEFNEWLWIFSWSAIIAFIIGRLRSLWARICLFLISLLSLSIIAFMLFNLGYWIPFIPPLLALMITIIILQFLRTKQLKKMQYKYILNYLKNYARQRPAVGQVAIEYFKNEGLF